MLKTGFEKLFQMREQASRRRPGADEGYDAHEKPFLDHLEDLRHTLMKIGATLAIATIACFAFHTQIFDLIKLPAKSPLAKISDGVTLWERLDLITLSPPEFIVLMLKLSFFSGVIITFPFTLYFLFQFILPGLREVEKRAVIPGALVGFALFLVGVSFAFFLAAPVALKFFYVFENQRISNIDPTEEAMEKSLADVSLLGIEGKKYPPASDDAEGSPEGEPDGEASEPSTLSPEMRREVRTMIRDSLATIEASNLAIRYDDTREKLVIVETKGGRSIYRIGEYINFISRLVLVFGISFQLPVVVSILVKLELLTARVMRATRTYAWIIIMVAAAILTPPDLMTLGLLAGPMILLYEICIVIASFIERGREKRQRAEEEARMSRLERLYSKPSDDLTDEEKEEIHRAELEQYEREHAHLLEDGVDHEHDDPHARTSLHGDDHDLDHDPHHDHDHEDHEHEDPYERHALHGEEPDPESKNLGAGPPEWEIPHEDEEHDPTLNPEGTGQGEDEQEGERMGGPDAGLESDHAEAEDLEPGEKGTDDSGEAKDHPDEPCEPEGPVIDVNNASVEELQTLPGVDSELAETIVHYRPFYTFDELESVPGVGPEILAGMIDRVMLG